MNYELRNQRERSSGGDQKREIFSQTFQHETKTNHRTDWSTALSGCFTIVACVAVFWGISHGQIGQISYAGNPSVSGSITIDDYVSRVREGAESIGSEKNVEQGRVEESKGNPESDSGTKGNIDSVTGGADSSRIRANEKLHKQIIANHEKATPTIAKFIETLSTNPRVQFTNLSGSHGKQIDIGHKFSASIDIGKATLPNPAQAKAYFETLNVTCESHKNFTNIIVPDDSPSSHYHCTDVFFIQQRLAKKFDKEYKLPENYEPWKHEIAKKIADKAISVGVEPKYPIAAAILESGITPSSIGDSGCSKGILQINACVNKEVTDTDVQIDMWLDNFKGVYEKTGSVALAVIDWNAPALASRGVTQTIYYGKYKKILAEVES